MTKGQSRAQAIKNALGEHQPQYDEAAIQSGIQKSGWTKGQKVRHQTSGRLGTVVGIVSHCILEVDFGNIIDNCLDRSLTKVETP